MRDRAILAVLFFTGCRISELENLQVKDYYAEQGFNVLDFRIKGGKRNRIAIHPECATAIETYLYTLGHINDPESFIFLTIKRAYRNEPGTKMSRKTLTYLWTRYAKKSGIFGSTPHSARATFITTALENNCPIELVRKVLGILLLRLLRCMIKGVKSIGEVLVLQ
ncbi:tyrosine-type recombinase/integrase [Candidatus Margulisiibacteriota bacterium]